MPAQAEASAPDLLRSLTVLGRGLFDAAACSIALLDDDESHLTFVAASGAGAERIVGVQLPVNRGIAGWVVSSGQPIGLDDVRSDARFDIDVAEATGYVPRSILAVPIDGPRDTLGVLQLLDAAPSADRQDMALLGLLSAHAALCVDATRRVADRPDATPEAPSAKEIEDLISELRGLRGGAQQTAVQLLSTFIVHTRR
jgi:signal transduction protein with GAF and PtsI domain